jgi:hypothetical protein
LRSKKPFAGSNLRRLLLDFLIISTFYYDSHGSPFLNKIARLVDAP